MSSTFERDQASDLAKRGPRKALERARSILDPWFKSQALAWVARYTEDDPVTIAREAAHAANQCDDEYKKTAVRAWEIAALAERQHVAEGRKALRATVNQCGTVQPLASCAEALTLLLHAAFRIAPADAKWVADKLKATCGQDSHWRCKRAVRDADKLLEGQLQPRPFFW